MGIMAEVHGKISSSGSNINDRMEDLLTSNVFQLFRYLPKEHGILPVLSSAENSYDGEQSRTFIIPAGVNNVSYHFWKRFNNCEPDVFIELKQDEKVLANIMIEAKYLSGKSGSAVYEEEEDGVEIYVAQSDQLEKLWNALKTYSADTPHYLFYLTMDWVMPTPSIDESIKAIADDNCRDSIYWLNWQSIHTTINEIVQKGKGSLSRAEELILTDILELLNKKGLKEFSGINITPRKNLHPFSYFNLKFFENIPVKQFESLKYYFGG